MCLRRFGNEKKVGSWLKTYKNSYKNSEVVTFPINSDRFFSDGYRINYDVLVPTSLCVRSPENETIPFAGKYAKAIVSNDEDLVLLMAFPVKKPYYLHCPVTLKDITDQIRIYFDSNVKDLLSKGFPLYDPKTPYNENTTVAQCCRFTGIARFFGLKEYSYLGKKIIQPVIRGAMGGSFLEGPPRYFNVSTY